MLTLPNSFRPASRLIAFFPAVLSDGWADCALGRVETGNPGRRGRAEIMLRPEQISLTRDGNGAVAKIAGVEFSGASSLVTLSMDGQSGAGIVLRQPSSATNVPGLEVRVAVAGRAHVLAAGDHD